MKKMNPLLFLPALIIVILDQATKLFIARSIHLDDTIPVVEGFFNLVHIRNRGMAFGMMNRPELGPAFYILVCVTLLAIMLLIYWLMHIGQGNRGLKFGLSLILGGATGNLIDRVFQKEVIDFLDFFIGRFHWPSFNIADSAITIGTVLVLLNLVFFKAAEKTESLGK